MKNFNTNEPFVSIIHEQINGNEEMFYSIVLFVKKNTSILFKKNPESLTKDGRIEYTFSFSEMTEDLQGEWKDFRKEKNLKTDSFGWFYNRHEIIHHLIKLERGSNDKYQELAIMENTKLRLHKGIVHLPTPPQ